MKAFLEDKDEAFAEAHQRALEWTDDFAVYAEKKCVETLQRVQREAQAHYDKQLLRQSLRLIRLPWAEKRAIALMNRQKMRNLLRLCAGWRKVDRSMPKYWRLPVHRSKCRDASPRHRRDIGSMACPWGSLTARFGQHGRVFVEEGLSEELSGALDSLVDLRTGGDARRLC